MSVIEFRNESVQFDLVLVEQVRSSNEAGKKASTGFTLPENIKEKFFNSGLGSIMKPSEKTQKVDSELSGTHSKSASRNKINNKSAEMSPLRRAILKDTELQFSRDVAIGDRLTVASHPFG